MNIFKLLLRRFFVTNNGEQVTVNGEKIYIMGREGMQFDVNEKATFSMYPTNYIEVIK